MKIVYSDPKHCGHTLANGLATAALILIGVPLLLLSSIVLSALAIIATAFLFLATLLVGCKMGYHYLRTKKNGVALVYEKPSSLKKDFAQGDFASYRFGDTQFTKKDLPRLKHEVKRLETVELFWKVMDKLVTCALCIIPFYGQYYGLSQTKSVQNSSGSSNCCRTMGGGSLKKATIKHPINHMEGLRSHIKIIQKEAQGENTATLRAEKNWVTLHTH